MSATIDIAAIISPDLRSRSTVGDLSLFIQNMNERSVVIDFANVKFVTRSFIDEFYNVFLKNKPSGVKIELANVAEDIQMIFDAVSRTQNKKKEVSEKSSVIKFRSIIEANNYFRALPI
jgi:anti-anti-sigma regulatory factor